MTSELQGSKFLHISLHQSNWYFQMLNYPDQYSMCSITFAENLENPVESLARLIPIRIHAEFGKSQVSIVEAPLLRDWGAVDHWSSADVRGNPEGSKENGRSSPDEVYDTKVLKLHEIIMSTDVSFLEVASFHIL